MTPVEQIELEIEQLKVSVDKANKMKALAESEEFIELFDKDFVEAYKDTSFLNLHTFKGDSLEGFVHHAKARSIFSRYVKGVQMLGKDAVEIIADLEQALLEEKKAEEAGENTSEDNQSED